MEEETSEYYPPRARWWSGLFQTWFRMKRLLYLDKIPLPIGFNISKVLLCLLLPGYAFFTNGRRTLGWCFAGLYVVSLILFIVALGYRPGNLGYGLMISVHASSIIFLEGCWLRDYCRFGLRLVVALLTLVTVWQIAYAPAMRLVEKYLVMPLRVHGNVVIIQRFTPPAQIRRGDWLMCSMPMRNIGDSHRREGAVWLQAGYTWGPVLAVAGDRVAFASNGFAVNGVEYPLLPHMPIKGEMVVPEKHWFVWPELAISGGGNVNEAGLAALMVELAIVSETEYVGKPFKHWFGRKQKLL